MSSYAILVDGGFIKRKLGSARAPMTAENFEAFIDRLKAEPCLQGLRLHRIYFYDALPFEGEAKKPLNGGKVNFGASPIVARSKRLHVDLVRVPYVALRMGELGFRGWQLKTMPLPEEQDTVEITAADLVPVIQQKGVDMRLGLDIAALTLKDQVKVIVLVAGDSDFVPAMKFARREGAQLFLAPLGHGIKEPMREHADLVLEIT
ncbi:NYN domain-containing protein [Zoogloea sp. LCSB751]|uniref:NYN domain-containing protein n=1 Tax=Zoogloea sp. LCSB751 TaxID=1965277 RepID=UPI0009A55050|nr:NYN domain-containing protein [Zoogloea sp. LCSB751]